MPVLGSNKTMRRLGYKKVRSKGKNTYTKDTRVKKIKIDEMQSDVQKKRIGGAIKGAKKIGMKIKTKLNERRMKKQLKKAGYDPKATSGPKTLSATIARQLPDGTTSVSTQFGKTKKVAGKSLGGIFRGKGALLPLFGLAGIAKYMDQNKKSVTVTPEKDAGSMPYNKEASGISSEETQGMSQGGMARGGGRAIRGTKFKGVF